MSNTITYKHYYAQYIKNVKGGPAKYKLSRSEYHVIVDHICKELRDYAIETGYNILLPYNLGTLEVTREKYVLPLNEDGSINYNKMRINWFLTSKLWKDKPEAKGFKFVYHTNSNGYTYRVEWVKYAPSRSYSYKIPWYTIKILKSFKQRISHYVHLFPHKLYDRDNLRQNRGWLIQRDEIEELELLEIKKKKDKKEK